MPEWIGLERLNRDLRFAFRTFARTPGFTAVVVLTLALGIGATSAIFSIVNAVLLHPLSYPNADRLVVIWEKLAGDRNGPSVFDSYRDFKVWKDASRSLDQLSAATWATGGQILTGSGAARDVLAMPAGLDFFSLLGVTPELGRTFQRDDLHQRCTAVLKYAFWVTAFGAQKNAIGRHIQLNETPCTIVGVMPSGFTFYPDALSMWTLITPDSAIARDPDNANVGVFGLLKPGVSIQRAQQEIELLYRNEHRKDAGGIQRIPVVYPLAEEFAYLTGPNLRLSVIVLFAAVSFVLLIACVNIANLLLGRSLARQKELAVRAALGSGRGRLVGQLLTEGLLLSSTGAFLGTLLAMGAVHFFRVLNPIEMPPGSPVRVNLQVLGFTAALAVATALAFGLVPALKACRIDLTDALRSAGRSASSGPHVQAFGKALVAAELMLSVSLLTGAGLLIQSVNRLASVPLGFRTDHLLTVTVELPSWRYSKDDQRVRFYRELLDGASVLPGVDSVAFASTLPLYGGRWGGSTLTVEGRAEPNGANAMRDVAQLSITPDYFRVMGVSIERGRSFASRDGRTSQPVAIVNEALVRKYFPHESPIGKHIKVGEPGSERPCLSMVGIAADEKDKNFFHEMAWEDIPAVFRPVTQNPPLTGSLVLRSAGDVITLGVASRKLIAALDSSVPAGEVQTMNEQVSRVLAYPRFRAVLLGTFAGFALLLAGVGVYGVLAQVTAQRTREFGVRMALGAQKSNVLALVMRQALVLSCAGVAAGLILTLGLAKLLSSLLYGVRATDPWTLAGVSVLLIVVALFAIWVPAARAAEVDPMIALREE